MDRRPEMTSNNRRMLIEAVLGRCCGVLTEMPVAYSSTVWATIGQF